MSSTQQTLEMIRTLAKVVKANEENRGSVAMDTVLEANQKIRELIKTLD